MAGGGAGLGAAIFAANGPAIQSSGLVFSTTLTLTNVTFNNNTAVGGAGGNYANSGDSRYSGGGGMGGNGASGGAGDWDPDGGGGGGGFGNGLMAEAVNTAGAMVEPGRSCCLVSRSTRRGTGATMGAMGARMAEGEAAVPKASRTLAAEEEAASDAPNTSGGVGGPGGFGWRRRRSLRARRWRGRGWFWRRRRIRNHQYGRRRRIRWRRRGQRGGLPQQWRFWRRRGLL